MLVEEIYRKDMRYTHKTVEFMDVYNFMRGLDDSKFKGEFENTIYLTTKFFREFNDNPLKTDKEKSEEKSKVFQAAIFSGTFTGNCHASELVSLSGLLVLDIDHLNKEELERVRGIINNCILTFCSFTSPSGTGLKVLIKHDLTIDKVVTDWKFLYKEVSDYYSHLTDTPDNFDNQTSDVSRICYLPYCTEKDIYLNKKSWTWEYKGLCKFVDDSDYDYEEVEITEPLYLEWFELTVFLAENSINIAETYGEWRDMGFSLASIGELGRELYHNISCVSNKYSHSECNKQFDLWLDTYQEGRTNIYRFVNVAKKAIEEFNQKQYEKFVG